MFCECNDSESMGSLAVPAEVILGSSDSLGPQVSLSSNPQTHHPQTLWVVLMDGLQSFKGLAVALHLTEESSHLSLGRLTKATSVR